MNDTQDLDVVAFQVSSRQFKAKFDQHLRFTIPPLTSYRRSNMQRWLKNIDYLILLCLTNTLWETLSDSQRLTDTVWQRLSDRDCLTEIVWQRLSDRDCLTETVWQTLSDRDCLTDTVWQTDEMVDALTNKFDSPGFCDTSGVCWRKPGSLDRCFHLHHHRIHLWVLWLCLCPLSADL